MLIYGFPGIWKYMDDHRKKYSWTVRVIKEFYVYCFFVKGRRQIGFVTLSGILAANVLLPSSLPL